MSYSLAVDIGGTFTDVVLRSASGALTVDKTLTTHGDLSEGFFRGVEQVLRKADLAAREIDGVIVHATTVVTNALIERRGSRTALITTRGFADVLAIRNEHRYDMYDPQIEFAEPLVPREDTFEIDERVLADGSVLRPVDAAAVRQLAATFKDRGVRSVAVCLLNSYRNPDNEQAVASILRSAAPGLYLSLSSSISPQIREYPRTSTTVINAYTMPITEPYLRGLVSGLETRGVPNKPLIMLSSGGIVGAELAWRNSVRMIESGPAAGVLAATHIAAQLGLDRLMSFDMGGTTAKACLIEGGKPRLAGSFEVDRRYRFLEGSGMPISVPSIDLIEIGAGGGSIAGIDQLGLLKVGPHSAGSMPGPACYGRGGREPTVTDADLLLGLLDASNFLGGDMRLDPSAAALAIGGLASRLGVGAADAAAGIYRVVAETMASAARTHATDRGIDYRGLPLLAFGGAGPVHACAVGALLESRAVIFPPQASVLSAFGTLVTPVRYDLVRSAVGRLDLLDWPAIGVLLAQMLEEGTRALDEAGCPAASVQATFGADLRYVGQQNEVTVSFEADPRESCDAAAIHEVFRSAYFAQYGVNPAHVPVELVSWRLSVSAPEAVASVAAACNARPAAPRARRPVALWPQWSAVDVYERTALAAGQVVPGPAIIEERETTIVLPPGWTATLEHTGCLVATPEPA